MATLLLWLSYGVTLLSCCGFILPLLPGAFIINDFAPFEAFACSLTTSFINVFTWVLYLVTPIKDPPMPDKGKAEEILYCEADGCRLHY